MEAAVLASRRGLATTWSSPLATSGGVAPLKGPEMRRPHVMAVPLAFATLYSTMASAQTSRSATEGYEDLIKAAQTVTANGPDLFGEQVNLQDGATSFRATDVAVHLTSGLPMALGRKLGINAKDYDIYTDTVRDGELFGNWALDVPTMRGVFDERTGWISAMANGQQRCSVSSAGALAPPGRPSLLTTYTSFEPSQYWSGNQINIPGAGQEPLLYLPATQSRPADGRSYYGTTRSNWRVSCLPSVLNGAGEGFLVVLPDGTRYTFNWMSTRRVSALRETACNRLGCRDGVGLNRAEVTLSATKVEDRFGNWVAYNYDAANPRRLLSVTSNEGASIQLTYNASGKISTISSHGRTWTYSYADPATLGSVTRPDGSRWSFLYDNIYQVARSDSGLLWRDCVPPVTDQDAPPPAGQILTITHPSGAVGTFKFRKITHGTTNTPGVCYDPDPDRFGDEQVSSTPAAYRIASLYSKVITGAGLAARSWSYRYAPSWSWAQECSPTVCPDNSTSQTTVTGPDGTVTRYTFGNNYQTNAGQLLAETVESAGVVVKQTLSTYVTSATGFPFADAVGLDPQQFTNHLVTEKNRPQRSSLTLQDGVTFSWYVNTFDAFVRATSVARFNNLGAGKTDVTEYHDNLVKWVIGLTARQLNAETGLVTAQTDYDGNALPLRTYAFGKLEKTLAYHTSGALASVTDGNGNTISLSSWKRGVPQLLSYPATPDAPTGATEATVVDDLGQITSVTEENGFTTSYAYDAMGRVSQVTYPGQDAVAWAPRTLQFRALTAADSLPAGISVGQYRQYSEHGNHITATYYDALWQPLLTYDYDAANQAATLRTTSTAYDVDGQVIFQSLPSAVVTPSTTGTRTTYDALGREIRSEQDSELGILVTTTEYLPGLQTRVTNPRGFQTTTSFLAWDVPSYDLPQTSQQPAGKVIEITRHPQFGWPKQLLQRSADGSLQQKRSYVYETTGRLCKTIEPETGATVMGYDGANNPTWSAAGLTGGTYESTSTCSQAEAWSSGRRVVRTYDARNQLRQLAFPDGRGDQLWTYEKDGLPRTITAWNDVASGAPVVTTYAYNKRRLLASESLQQPGWYTWAIGYDYDALGNLRAQTYPTGLVVDYAPNALGQPTKAGSYASGASYYPNGALKQFTYGNGIVHTMTQNARQLPGRVSSSGGVADFAYSYDHNGNVASIWDHARDTGNGYYGRWLSYDGADRLTAAGSCTFGGDCWHQFTYDALDNLKSWKLGGVKDYADYVYQAQTHRLTAVRNTAGAEVATLTYDPQGNLASKNGQAYEFDYGNRLRNVPGKESYRYDALGRRVLTAKPGGAQVLWMYARGGEQLFSWEGPSDQKTREQVYLAGSLIATITHAWPSNAVLSTRYQHTDGLGSPVAVSNEAGAVVERNDYEPFGAIINKPTFSGIGFGGHVMDGGTGLTYMQQRYYDQTLGRFLSVDPVAADASSGTHFNRYKFASNNPYRFADPDGRMDKETRKELAEERRRQANERMAVRGSITGRAGSSSAQVSTGSRTAQAGQRSAGKPSTGARQATAATQAGTSGGSSSSGGSGGKPSRTGFSANGLLVGKPTLSASGTAAGGVGIAVTKGLVNADSSVGITTPALGLEASVDTSLISLTYTGSDAPEAPVYIAAGGSVHILGGASVNVTYTPPATFTLDVDVGVGAGASFRFFEVGATIDEDN